MYALQNSMEGENDEEITKSLLGGSIYCNSQHSDAGMLMGHSLYPKGFFLFCFWRHDEVSTGKGDICPLALGKAYACPMGLIVPDPAILEGIKTDQAWKEIQNSEGALLNPPLSWV